MKNHRRHDLTDDDDWPILRTLPVFGQKADLDTGAIVELFAPSGRLNLRAEFMNGAGDGATPVSEVVAGDATFTIEGIQYLGRSGGVYDRGTAKTGCNVLRALVEGDVEPTIPLWVRIVDVVGAPAGATHLWIWVGGAA